MKYKSTLSFFALGFIIFLGSSCDIAEPTSSIGSSDNSSRKNNKKFIFHEEPIITEVPFNIAAKVDFSSQDSIENGFGITLSAFQKKIDAQHLPLHPKKFLPFPKNSNLEFDEKVWENFLAQLPAEKSALLKKIYNQKQLITYEMFALGLQAIMQKFNEFVPEDYAVGVLYNKSLHWASSIASVYFSNSALPVAAWIPEDFPGGTHDHYMKKAQDVNAENFVIFLDVELTGETLYYMLYDLDKKEAMKNKRVITFVPFISDEARSFILEDPNKRINRIFKRITPEIVTTDFKLNSILSILKKDLTEEPEKIRPNLLQNPKLAEKFPDFAEFLQNIRFTEYKHKHDNVDEDEYQLFSSFFSQRLEPYEFNQMDQQTTVYTEWKIPNRKSFFLKFLQKIVLPRYNMSNLSFLPKIAAPYKNIIN